MNFFLNLSKYFRFLCSNLGQLFIQQIFLYPLLPGWHPTLVLLPGKFPGQRSLVGCRPWGHEESDTTERLHFHFSLSCIGEGNGNPLQRSCLENPRDGGAWWAAVSGVSQSRTRLKRLSSSSSNCADCGFYKWLLLCWDLLFIILRYGPSIPTFVRVFIMNECWILSDTFFASIEMIL